MYACGFGNDIHDVIMAFVNKVSLKLIHVYTGTTLPPTHKDKVSSLYSHMLIM